ncbi:MAG: DNA (cytosine-5-)-methyltransferase [Phycisphaerae bacterium]
MDRKRLIQVTAGNLRNSHIYITGHHDLFPSDCFGGPRQKSTRATPIVIELDGLQQTVETDIGTDARTGRPRRQFRARSWVKDFFKWHGVAAGDWVCLRRLAKRRYRLTVEKGDWGRYIHRTFLEFFAGIGLVRMGLEARGWRLAYANDIDPQKRDMYDVHFGNAAEHFHVADIHDIAVDDIPDATLATASFPCTDLSVAGGRRGLRGTQSSAFFGFIRVLEELGDRRPPVVLIENVLGFLTSHNGGDFQQAMSSLNELGYSVDPFVLDAKWFVPQSRPRLFVIATMLNGHGDDFCQLASPTRLRPSVVTEFIASHANIHWSLRELPQPPQRSTKCLKDILDDLPDDAPEWWSKYRADYLYDQMSSRHRVIADAWIRKRCWSFGTVFRRVRQQPDGHKRSMGELRCDGLAGCLRTPKGGSGRQILFKAGYGKYAARLLTPNECAKLMGADGFKIEAPVNQALFGFGDAVCVPAISWIAEHYLNPMLRGIPATCLGTHAGG